MGGVKVVTSMSQEGYDQYGKTFIDTFWKHWKVPLTIYSEDQIDDDRFEIRNSLEDPELVEFLKDAPEHQFYQWNARKFAYKVFAITGHERDTDWLIWLDADVVTCSEITPAFLSKVCRGRFGSYLGREEWHHSECGWVAYHLPDAGPFLDRLRDIYTSGEIYSHLEYHDSYLFDRVREEFPDWHNLSEGIKGMHVWDESPLGEKMKHLKGPLRKQGKTGTDPKYWSESERAI